MPQGKTHLGKMLHRNEDSFEPGKLNTNVSKKVEWKYDTKMEFPKG